MPDKSMDVAIFVDKRELSDVLTTVFTMILSEKTVKPKVINELKRFLIKGVIKNGRLLKDVDSTLSKKLIDLVADEVTQKVEKLLNGEKYKSLFEIKKR